ncbi:hypothetical protein TWF481_000547 [Arthrobotrys musiformis]|uniref:ubiquitinyl hydrolase 1 n=1 Tax=Arthrobotrys musiformis TaxID=47236 RepID=A0AAV9WMX3_9PEZI
MQDIEAQINRVGRQQRDLTTYRTMAPFNIDFLIQNIVLPPNLPQEEPENLQGENFRLLEFVAAVIKKCALGGFDDQNTDSGFVKAHDILGRMVDIHNPRHDLKIPLKAKILGLEPGGAFGLHVVGQNAGITFRRVEDSLRFETFEVSPLPAAPVNCKGRLKCTYPGATTTIPWDIVKSSTFSDRLVEFLDHMTSQEFTSETLSKTRKGGNEISETRSSPDPRYIVELFTGIMRGIGEEAAPRMITKSIRDEANWNNSYKPWRRSGMWLVIRVVLQTTLENQQYKFVMLEVIRALLNEAIVNEHESYAISCTSKKLARRCQKENVDRIPAALLGEITKTMEKCSDLLKNRWDETIAKSNQKVIWNSKLSTEGNIARNMAISLPKSRPWIKERLREYGNPQTTRNEALDPAESRRFLTSDYFPLLEGETEAQKAISLVDFEIWVQKHLETWTSRNRQSAAIKTLASKIQEYHKVAAKAYQDHNVLDVSRMVLTIMEMWVRLDKSVCSEQPLLKGYTPEIPEKILEPLLFVQESDMKRVLEVEKYIAGRYSAAELEVSIFCSRAKSDSFATRYYSTNTSLQNLKARIIEEATKDRAAKIRELKASNEKHAEISTRYKSMGCDYPHRGCTRCWLKREADNMTISAHEWPLPEDDTEAECVVFELQPPQDFTIWRETTYYIMIEVFSTDPKTKSKAQKSYRLGEWRELRQQNDGREISRITWASRDKPIVGVSHYRNAKIPAAQSDVIFKHSGKFRLYDSEESLWVESHHKTCTLKPLCKSIIAGSVYEKLSYAVNDVRHTPNETIARQFECPTSLTLREYDAFTTLRSGRHLQWYNIFMELHKRDLTLNKDPVYLLLLHAACHIGKATDCGDWRRDSHITLSEKAFSRELLRALETSLSVLRDSWEQVTALKVLVMLAQRLLSCGHESTRPKTLQFLKDAREVCDPWISSIKDKIESAEGEEKMNGLRQWLLKIAGIQYSTFDVDEAFFSEVFGTSADIANYLICQNIIYDNSLGVFRGLPPDLELLLERNRRFSVIVEPFIQKKLRSDGETILQSVIEGILPSRASGGIWNQVEAPANRWWVYQSHESRSEATTIIHLNILEGKLLVNGKPNGRLPTEYFAHKNYKALLGQTILDVVASGKFGISYETKGQYRGQKLYFHLQGEDLVIRKSDENGGPSPDNSSGRIAEFVPPDTFYGDIARTILKCGTQWLDLTRKEIIFYQRPEWWQDPESSVDWVLDLSPDGNDMMCRNGAYIMDINGDIHSAIASLFSPIETKDYIVATKTEGLPIDLLLPRYKLEFFLNNSNIIECRSLRGWTLDANQSIGTFIGLRNFIKLRLDDKTSIEESVLVPYGEIKAYESNSAARPPVAIEAPMDDRGYTIYRVDRILGRLVDDGTLRARYTRIYLHALCSGILPDPLTGRSGVEEALDGLRSAASFSFQTLQGTEASILKLIANLTPKRSFYPGHLRVMQQIDWRSLPIWVQNDNFYPLVSEIFKDWSSRQFLLDGSVEYEKPDRGSIDLLERARYHNSVFDCGDPEASNRIFHSNTYKLRNTPENRETGVCDLSKVIFEWSQGNDLDSNPASHFVDLPKLSGPDCSFAVTPRYNADVYEHDPVTNWDPETKRLLKSLATIAASGSFHDIVIPSYSFFQPNIGHYPTRDFIKGVFKESAVSFGSSQYSSSSCTAVARLPDDSYYDFERRRERAYEEESARQVEAAANEIMLQSTADNPQNPSSRYSLLSVRAAMERIRARFEICRQNRELSRYFKLLSERLGRFMVKANPVCDFDKATVSQSIAKANPADGTSYSMALTKLLSEREAPDLALFQLVRQDETTKSFFVSLAKHMDQIQTSTGESVEPIIDRLQTPSNPFSKKYGKDLKTSVAALKSSVPPAFFDSGFSQALMEGNILEGPEDYSGRGMLWYRDHSTECLKNLFVDLQSTLSPETSSERLLKLAGLWPTSTKLEILQQLCLKQRDELSCDWVSVIACFGEAITWVQRSKRMCKLASQKAVQEIEKEIHGFHGRDWDVNDFIDWLLFEIDSEMLVRPIQATIGLEMMREKKTGNAVMQLNMGEGKSAVIMPIVAAALADTTRLVRPIVLKPLSTQMFEILVQRLSGLCDRRIYFLPFNRDLKVEPTDVTKIQDLYKRCKENGDILLALPEHLLSFKLMGMEKLIQGKEPLANLLVKTQGWLNENARDILDESDEILQIRYQLIYTMGQQQPLEGDQDRWTVIQDLLDYLQEQARVWAAKNPTAVEVLESEELEDKYPMVRIIDQENGERMLHEIARKISMENIDKMPSVSSKIRLLSHELREKVYKFIAFRKVEDPSLQEIVLRECNHLKVQLLVLRGLLADGVLLFLLRDKRYRVDYGLDPKRSNLAVPYRAKDRPALKAEFGHPEVVLTLTHLTYYYGGLEDSQLESCFELLFKTDDPDLTYENWTMWTKQYKDIPASLSELRGLNLLDQDQLNDKIYPFFRYNKHVIDFFLSELIFPREAKGFPYKLSTSGWDIAQSKHHNVTGFSGTNDNRYLLPTSVTQLDLEQQLHTNALVLTNILREENDNVIKLHKDGNRLNADETLGEIVALHTPQSKPEIRVLLDVGAQILELTNRQVAQEWLKQEKSPDIHGAVFFGDNDDILVMRRDGKVEPFVSSSLSKQLDQALVYLDEAHTRGTDLKLPEGTRAAVTLGPNLPKDKFVQGCMRMRKLGKGHSLTFLASPDIYSQIQKTAGKSDTDGIGVSDVLLWTMQESCRQIQHGFAIWADQGFQYLKRRQGWDDFESSGDRTALGDALMEIESRPLIDMYGVNVASPESNDCIKNTPDGKEIVERLEEFSVKVTNSVRVQEEQEREVDHEVEEESNTERPEPAKAMEHRLAPELITLVKCGRFRQKSNFFKPPFSVFADTSSREYLEANIWAADSSEFVTNDFSQTVEKFSFKNINMDDYLRPVRWILQFDEDGKHYLIFISPYEANELMPDIRLSPFVRMHCYAPRVSRGMPNFEYFDICPVESLLPKSPGQSLDMRSRIRLNLFAGQLFFENEKYYQALCEYLGLEYGAKNSSGHGGNDGWVMNANLNGEKTLAFSQSPIPFLRAITRIRRKGQGFASTHLGGVVDSRVLSTNDF